VNSKILEALSKDDLLALILAQQVQIETRAVQIGALTARIAEQGLRTRSFELNQTVQY